MSALFVKTLNAPINDNTLKSLNEIDLENVNNYFEIIYGDKPMRPYIDIDGQMNDITNEEFNNLDLDILNKLCTLNDCSIITSSKYGCVDKSEVINKLSYRLTFYNEICKDKNDCKNFIQSVKYPMLKRLLGDIIDVNDKKKYNSLNVDFSVYRSKGKMRCVNAYKNIYDKTRINRLVKGNIEQTIIYANYMNSLEPELETKGEPILLKNQNEIIEIKPLVQSKKINKLQQELYKEKENQKNEDNMYDDLIDFYHSYFLNDLLNVINIKKLEHQDWVKVVLSFKKCDGVFEDLIDWNKNHKNFNIDGLTSLWEQYTDEENEMSIATLKHYAELTNKKRYIVWNQVLYKTLDICNGVLEKNLAKLYIAVNTDNLISHNDNFYVFQKNKWNKCNNNKFSVLRYNYSEVMEKYFKDILKNLKKVMNDYDSLLETQSSKELFDKQESFRKHYNRISEVKLLTGRTQWINNVLKEIRNIMEVNTTDKDLFDKQHHLFCFTNAIFDLNTGENVEPNKKLYITMNSGKRYYEPTEKQINTIHNLFVSIFPDPEIRKCYLSILRTALSGYRLEKIVVANGNGRNGKGLINELTEHLCGDYFYKLPVDALTKDINMVGANPQFANLNNKRFVVCCEPEDSRSIKMHTAKEITGCNTLNARGLYESETKTNLLLTLVIEANKRPELSGRMDNAILNRLIDVNFVHSFSDNPDLINNIDCFEENRLYKQDTFKDKHYCALFKYILMNAPNNLYVPEVVKIRSKEYVVENEDFFGWFNEKYVITNDVNNDIVRVKDLFNNYKNSDFYFHLTEKEKRKNTLKNFRDKIRHHLVLKNHYRDNKTNKVSAVRLVGIREKFEDSDSDSD